MCSIIPPGASWKGRGTDLLYAACDAGVFGDPGLGLGEHRVRMVAELPGTGLVLRSEEVRVTLSCAAAAARPSLELTATTDKRRYRPAEEIRLTVHVRNTGRDPLTLVHPDYWGVSEIRVTDAAGRAVEPRSYKAGRKSVASLLTIPGGEARTHTFERLTAYTCCYAYSFDGRLGPGRYRIVVTLTNPPVRVKPPDGWRGGFVGTLVAEPIEIEVER